MKYQIPLQYFLYSILTSGERFENLLEQQLILAEHGISFSDSDALSDIEREVLFDRAQKHDKDKIEFEVEKFKAYAKLFGAKVPASGGTAG